VRELEPEEAEKLIFQCYQAGVRYIDFTGGEPTLSRMLVRLVQYAKKLGIKTEVTTNGIPHGGDILQEAAKCADKFNISLDTLKPDIYRQIRGVGCMEKVLAAIREIMKVRPPKIMMAVSRENLSEMKDMIRFARQNCLEIYLNPVFTYFESFESDCRESGDYTEQVLSEIYTPYTVVMLHFIEFIRNTHGYRRPACSANRRTLTFAPDGSLMLPCYHGLQETIPWNGSLSEMLSSESFAAYAGGELQAGLCEGCAVIPYFGISFAYCLDQYFLLQSYSEKLNHLKRDFLNRVIELKEADREIYSQLKELVGIVRSLDYSREHKSSWLYWTRQQGQEYLTDIYRKPLTEEEYQRERRAEECWQLTLVPHYEFDRICQNRYKKVFASYQEKVLQEEAVRIFQDAAEFQLRLWKYYISRYMRVSAVCDYDAETLWLKSYWNRLEEWERRYQSL